MKRKLVIAALATCVCMSFCGCGNKEKMESLEQELSESKAMIEDLQNQLSESENLRTIGEENLTKANQTISDYRTVYGEVNRSDVDLGINPENAEKHILVMYDKNPVLCVEKDGLQVALNEVFYVPGNEDLTISLAISNETSSQFFVKIENVYVGEYSLPNMFEEDNGQVDAGTMMSTCEYFLADQLNASGYTDFDRLGCTLVINAPDGTNLYSRDIVIMRSAFTESVQ